MATLCLRLGAWQFAAAIPEAREAGGVLTKLAPGGLGDADLEDGSCSSVIIEASPSRGMAKQDGESHPPARKLRSHITLAIEGVASGIGIGIGIVRGELSDGEHAIPKPR